MDIIITTLIWILVNGGSIFLLVVLYRKVGGLSGLSQLTETSKVKVVAVGVFQTVFLLGTALLVSIIDLFINPTIPTALQLLIVPFATALVITFWKFLEIVGKIFRWADANNRNTLILFGILTLIGGGTYIAFNFTPLSQFLPK